MDPGIWTGPDTLLVGAAAAMGLGGAWHCAVMCGPLCGSLGGGSSHRPIASAVTFQLTRALSYGVAGMVLASSASWATDFVIRGGAGPLSPWLTLWALAHAAAMSLGLFLLWAGRQPVWLARLGSRKRADSARVGWWGPATGVGRVGRGPERGKGGSGHPGLLGLLGLLWALLPCGLLQSALVVATLGSGPWAGGGAMLAFALGSMPGLLAAPLIVAWLRRLDDQASWQSRLTRASGLMLAAASAWALGHGLWVHVRDYC